MIPFTPAAFAYSESSVPNLFPGWTSVPIIPFKPGSERAKITELFDKTDERSLDLVLEKIEVTSMI